MEELAQEMACVGLGESPVHNAVPTGGAALRFKVQAI
jgi:hypothetical protein